MFNIIVFSKDRACQLDLFLRSWEKFVDIPGKINVLYTYTQSNDRFRVGYEKLIDLHPSVNFVPEDDFTCFVPKSYFYDRAMELINPAKPNTIFFVDDIVFINKFSTNSEEFTEFKINSNILALSLRLGKNINYCYPSNSYCPGPELKLFGRFDISKGGYWSYPMSIDGNIYKTADLLPILKKIEFKNPNTLEYQMACNPINKSEMVCFESSRLINLAINRVQDEFKNRAGSASHHFLNDGFLNGKTINLDQLLNQPQVKNSNSCHIETELVLK
jgi:hypothetical protein